jgi:hypothetical protein
MARKTYVYRDGELVEKQYAAPLHNGAFLMPDIAEFVTQDGERITSRSHLRDYERRHGVKQSGNEWTGSGATPDWFRAACERSEGNHKHRR